MFQCTDFSNLSQTHLEIPLELELIIVGAGGKPINFLPGSPPPPPHIFQALTRPAIPTIKNSFTGHLKWSPCSLEPTLKPYIYSSSKILDTCTSHSNSIHLYILVSFFPLSAAALSNHISKVKLGLFAIHNLKSVEVSKKWYLSRGWKPLPTEAQNLSCICRCWKKQTMEMCRKFQVMYSKC